MGSFPLKKKRKTFQGGKDQLPWSISTVVKINFKMIMLFCGQPPTPWSHHWSGHLWWQGCTWV